MKGLFSNKRNRPFSSNPFDCHVCMSPTKVVKLIFDMQGKHFSSTKVYKCTKCDNSFTTTRNETKEAILKVKNRYNE